MNKSIILHAKIITAKILFNKRFFNFYQIFRQYQTHFEIKFLKFLLEFDNFLLNKISGQRTNVGVNYVIPFLASVEANREVRRGLHCMVI